MLGLPAGKWQECMMLNSRRGSLSRTVMIAARKGNCCLFVRSLASSASQISLKPFEEMPTATVWDRLRLISPRNETRRHKLIEELHRKHGKMFKLHFPGLKHTQVWTCDPQHIKEVLAQVELKYRQPPPPNPQDGPAPITPGFDFFVAYRSHVRKELWRSGGLVGAHGRKWYEVNF